MKSLRVCILLLVAWAGASGPAPLRAQSNPPFQNPALDSNCYFPQIGVPGEIDTIVGDSVSGGIGAYIHNLGPKADGTPGNLLIGNGNSVFELAPTGSTFNLHNLKAKAQGYLNLNPQDICFGHFHDQAHLDIFDEDTWVIYWSDDNGNYDTARKTQLMSNISGRLGYSKYGLPPYIATFLNDSVDDIVLGSITNNFPEISTDTLFLLFYHGGQSLWNTAIKFEDTSDNFGKNTQFDAIQGNFRGNGSQDFIAEDENNTLYYFRNDPPFSLQNLVSAIQFDTLCNQVISGFFWSMNPPVASIVMPLLPKTLGDHSVDFSLSIPVVANTSDLNNVYIFRGGSDFGSHRITLDSAAYKISPPDFGFQVWPGSFVDGGDMTGTGNHVLCTGGGANGSAGYADETFYVTGQALDSLIDIFYEYALAGARDALTANADSLEDLMMAGPDNWGTIWLMYGSKQIPVHLNPQFADVKSIPQENGAGITFAPNPVTQTLSVATIVWPDAEDAEYEVYNILGAIVQKGTIRLIGGAEQQRIYFPNLASGVYVLVIHGESNEARAKLVFAR